MEAKDAQIRIKKLLAEIKTPELAEMASRLQDDRNIFDFREHIALLEAMAFFALEKNQWDEAAKLIRSAITAIEKLHNIEVGRRVVIDTRDVDTMLQEFAKIVHKYVDDPHVKAMIARDIARLEMPQEWDRPKAIEGKVIDVQYSNGE